MIEVVIPRQEYFDEQTGAFFSEDERTLRLEHSLLSLSKWEMAYKRPFMTNGPKTRGELTDYYRFMCLERDVKREIFYSISIDDEKRIQDYINDSMTASWFPKNSQNGRSREIITNEVIYSWMVSLQIPFECEKWHLNRLMVLIRICSQDQGGGKKMSKGDILKQNRALNAARRAKLGTKG